MKTGTRADATIASASVDDVERHWVKHRGRSAIYGVKAHVSTDTDTALVEKIAVTPTPIDDGKAGPGALRGNPGDDYADSAYRGDRFGKAVIAKCARRPLSLLACGDATKQRFVPVSIPGTNLSLASAVESPRFSTDGNEATACAGCDSVGSQRQALMFA